MRVHHQLHVGGQEPRAGEPLEEREVEHVPDGQGARLAVADTRVDEHGAPVDLDDERLHSQADRARGCRPIGHQPRMLLHELLGRVRKEKAGRNVVLRLDHTRDRRGTDLPTLRLYAHAWAGLDSNQRSGNATGLQPVPFGHSGTDPDLI